MQNHQIKAAIVGALERKFRSIFASKTACILHVQAAADASLINRAAQIAQLHSTRSSVNSGEKPAGFYEELTQKTEPKFVKTSSVFLETDDIFRACFAITHLQKQGTAASEPSNNLRFLIKKKRRTRRRKRSKNLKTHIYLYQFYLPVSFQKHELHLHVFYKRPPPVLPAPRTGCVQVLSQSRKAIPSSTSNASHRVIFYHEIATFTTAKV